MDRKYKAKDRVLVFETSSLEKPIAEFYQAPYSYAGFDSYKYKGVMYSGYTMRTRDCPPVACAYILLSEPLK
jgi:hypothetical protein